MIEFWKDVDDKDIHAECTFDPETHDYTVKVYKGDLVKEESFQRLSFTPPLFGMDVSDRRNSQMIAEKLAIEIEKELGI